MKIKFNNQTTEINNTISDIIRVNKDFFMNLNLSYRNEILVNDINLQKKDLIILTNSLEICQENITNSLLKEMVIEQNRYIKSLAYTIENLEREQNKIKREKLQQNKELWNSIKY